MSSILGTSNDRITEWGSLFPPAILTTSAGILLEAYNDMAISRRVSVRF